MTGPVQEWMGLPFLLGLKKFKDIGPAQLTAPPRMALSAKYISTYLSFVLLNIFDLRGL